MKQHTIWSIAIAVFAALSLVSCGKDDDNEPTSDLDGTSVSASVIQNKIRLKFFGEYQQKQPPRTHIGAAVLY